MKKAAFFLITVIFTGGLVWAVPTDEIAGVRQRLSGSAQIVSETDRTSIDRFWRIALDAMLLSQDPEQLISIRRQIEQEKGDLPLSFYATAYVQVGREHLKSAFETIARWDDLEKKTLMERNLMILTAQLQSPLLAELGLTRLEHPDDVVRYWAVKTVAGSGIAQQLADSATGDPVLTDKILKALAERVAVEPGIETLRTIVTFAAMVNRDAAREILTAAAQRRIKVYRDWNVDHEAFDAVLLKLMGQVVLSESDSLKKAAMARHFAELFSMVFQRYLTEPSPLTDDQKRALLNVVVEVDSQILTKMLGQQTPILRAIQRPTGGLDREYESIFGSEAGPGQLSAKLNFNYGKTPDGRVQNAPPKLPAPPKKQP